MDMSTNKISTKFIDINGLERFFKNIKKYISYQIAAYQYYKPCITPDINNGKIVFNQDNPIQAGVVYNNFNEITSLTISSFSQDEQQDYAEYIIHFNAGNECNLILPSYIYWSNGVIPLIEKSYYELNISATKQNNEWIYKAILVPFKQII